MRNLLTIKKNLRLQNRFNCNPILKFWNAVLQQFQISNLNESRVRNYKNLNKKLVWWIFRLCPGWICSAGHTLPIPDINNNFWFRNHLVKKASCQFQQHLKMWMKLTKKDKTFYVSRHDRILFILSIIANILTFNF